MTDTLKYIRKNWIAVLLVLAVSLAANAAQPMRMDDATFLATFTSHGNDLWSWAQEYRATWSGRVIPHGIFLILLAASPELVNILNAVMITLSLIWSAEWAIGDRKTPAVTDSLILVLMAFGIYVLTPTDILDVTLFWKTASVLYIWGFAAMLLVLKPFMASRKEPGMIPRMGIFRSLALILPALYCAEFEPSGSFYFAFGGIFLLRGRLKRRDSGFYPWHLIACWLVTSAAFLFSLSAPGNIVRFREEALFWFPNYGLFGFWDKVFLGASYMLGACLNEIYLTMLLLTLVIFLLMIVRKRGIILTVTAFLPFLYYGLYPLSKGSPAYAFVYNDVYGLYSSANWGATFLGLFVLALIALLILVGISEKPDIVNALFYTGAVAEQVVMGFTPTVAVSISRSSFFSRELLMIPLFSLLLTLVLDILKLRKVS
ncbi:MAG: DUF6056 family protein [Lachnospiraceae bacterium]|nr:DUF6056 family protein [Lachnospiraceae bacterium]